MSYHNKHLKFMGENHNYSNLAQSQILFYMPQQPMVPGHGAQYEEKKIHAAIMEECMRMDWQIVGWTEPSITYQLKLIWMKQVQVAGVNLKVMKVL